MACVKDKGFTVHADTQGSVGFESPKDVPSDQMDLAQAAIFDCQKEVYPDAENQALATPEQLRKLYKLNLEAKTCLEDKGITVKEPPSEQVFVDTFHNPGPDGAAWSPWGLETMKQMPPDKDAVDAIRIACPDPMPLVSTL